jgi:hydroxymethylglutaryl-CoA synthase
VESDMDVGIEAIGLYFPKRYLDVRELARVRGVDENKYLVGLGCERIAICSDGETVVELLAAAAERAIENWGR